MGNYKKAKMCDKKVSFRSFSKAQKVAEKYNQKVYECPICFCFHCTSKESWRDEYVDAEKHSNLVRDHEKLLQMTKGYRTKIKSMGKLLEEKNLIINDLKIKIKKLEKGLRQ